LTEIKGQFVEAREYIAKTCTDIQVSN